MRTEEKKAPLHFYNDVLAALQARQELTFTQQNSLTDLVLVRNYRNELGQTGLSSRRLAINHVLDEALSILSETREELAHILQRKFIDGESHREIAEPDKGVTVDAIKSRQKKGIQLLVDIIWKLEVKARKERRDQLIGALPLMRRERVFGVQHLVEQVTNLLLNPNNDNVVAITGIGGIGKTTLAQSAVFHIIDQFYFDHILWIHINNQQIDGEFLALRLLLAEIMQQMNRERCTSLSEDTQRQQIRHTLESAAYLIVVDNLEKEIAPELLLQLHEWSGPSRFLITSRLGMPLDAGVQNIQLNELTLEAATALIHDQAQRDGPLELAHLSQAEAKPICTVVGGNPLALKLVVGLARTRPLSQILNDLLLVKTQKSEDLYLYIYQKAWQALSENGRSLLEMMYAADETGFEADDMQALSKLDEAEFWAAVDELAKRSLLEVRGTIYERRYGIHRLTATFLQTEIIHWPDNWDDTN